MAKRALTYKDAGVDVEANTRWVERIRHAMHGTYGPRVVSRHNAFAGMFRLDFNEQLFKRNYRDPVLVGCADGVGTKVMLAVEMNDLSTVGIDLVAMNVNDMITCGAEPLFFLDYLGVHKIAPDDMVALMDGIAEGCRQAGCALLGGETAEMPDIYGAGELDMAGFAVGVVELNKQIDPQRVEPGDVLIGLPSSGIHSNGYSLVRRVIREGKLDLGTAYPGLGETLGEAVLRPTRIYVKPILQLLRAYRVKRVVTSMAHITGGGLAENIARCLPDSCDAIVERKCWTVPPIFTFLRKQGVARKEMYRVFNMGIGMVLVVRPAFAAAVCRRLQGAGEEATVIGRVQRGCGKVRVK